MIELAKGDFLRVAGLFDSFGFHRGHWGSVLQGRMEGRVHVDDTGCPRGAMIWPADGFQYLASDGHDDAAFLEACNAVFERELAGACREVLVAQAGLAAGIDRVFGGLPHFAVERFAYRPPSGPPPPVGAPAEGGRFSLSRDEGSILLTLEDGHGEVGSCRGMVYGRDAEIDIRIVEGRRRQGWGSFLAAEFLTRCFEAGLVPQWSCWADKEESNRLARRLGFHSPEVIEVHIYDPES